MIFTAFYTVGTLYEREAARLRRSLDRLGLRHDIRGIPDGGSWAVNAGYTATFLCDALDAHKGQHVVYLDADAIVWRDPVLFDELPGQCDIAAHRCAWGQLANGTLWLSNSDACRDLIHEYRRRVAAVPNERDEQRHLDFAIEAADDAVKVHYLPASYCYIHRLMAPLPDELVVIEHLQASRESTGSSLLPQRRARLAEVGRIFGDA